MAEPFIGQVQTFAFNWAPVDWLLANGQPVPVSQYQALYALLGNSFGGNTTNFNLPNLNGRAPIGQGYFADNFGSTNYAIGAAGGVREIALSQANLALHSHPAQVTQGNGAPVNVSIAGTKSAADSPVPTAASPYLASANDGQVPPNDTMVYGPAGTATPNLAGVTVSGGGTISQVVVGPTGNNIPFSIVQPYLPLNFSIAAFGLFPQRP